MTIRTENLILSGLVHDIEFLRKVSPHLNAEYFSNRPEQVVFQLFDGFIKKYSKPPAKDSMLVEFEELIGLSDDEFKEGKSILKNAFAESYEYEPEWLFEQTEKFCRDKALLNAIMASVAIISGDDKKQSEGIIPKLLSDALAVSFDKNVGHDYFENAIERLEFYNLKEKRIKTDIELLNKITGGGLPRKTLNLLLGASGSGKSAVKCALGADYLKQGYNVLYITMELAEERIAERIDANLMNIQLQEVREIPEASFHSKIEKLKSKTNGQLIIKEYPTGVGSVTHFESLLDELKLKKNFTPDVVIVDYLGITASARYKNAAGVNSYTYQKSVAEELRGFAVKNDLLLWSSIQTNRQGTSNSDFDESAIADSMGTMMTADVLLAIIRTEELNERQQLILKQLKNRFGDLSYYRKFVVGFDFSRMKMYNIEAQGQIKSTETAEPVNRVAPTSNKKFDFDFGE